MRLSEKELLQRLNEAKQQVSVGSLYQHYKSPDMIYRVLDIVIHEADDMPCVIYQAQYGEGITFSRPVTSWIEKVNSADESVHRFTKI